MDPLEALRAAQLADAMTALDRDGSLEPRWFSPKLDTTLGPVCGTDFIVVGARPSGGKSTFLMAAMRSFLEQEIPVLYAGQEMPPAQLLTMMAAWDLKLDHVAAIRAEWMKLPTGAKTQLQKRIKELVGDKRLVLIPDGRLTVPEFLKWSEWASSSHAQPVFIVDHIHQMDWGTSDPSKLTGAMAEGLRRMREWTTATEVRTILGAQLKRGENDVLEDYMVPPQSAIKQCGATEELAILILMLHRALKKGVVEGDLALVRRGQMPVSSVAEDGTMAIHVAKSRYQGELRDMELRLYVGGGKLFDNPEDRERQVFD